MKMLCQDIDTCLTNCRFRTVYNFKHLLGRKFNDPIVQDTVQSVPYQVTLTLSNSFIVNDLRTLRLGQRRSKWRHFDSDILYGSRTNLFT